VTAATVPTLELAANVRSFLTADPPRYATLATINRDGSPHQIVIWFLVRGDAIVVNSRRGRRWPTNLERDGRANLAVYEGEDAVTINCMVERVYDGEAALGAVLQVSLRVLTVQAMEELPRCICEPEERLTVGRDEEPLAV